MALKITITNAGRAEIINADNTGTGPVEITHIAFTETAFVPSDEQTALPSEIKRVSSIAGEVVADDTISVTAKDEGHEAYTVRGFGLITEHGTLFAVYSQADPIIEKAAPTTLLLTTDIIFSDLPTASLTFGDISFSNPPASLTTPGVVTLSKAVNSTAQNQAATPAAVKSANDNANTRLIKSQNLADLTSPATARVNLGLGTSATLGNTALRTSSSTTLLLQAAAMNDHRTSGDHDDRYPQRGNNLSDLPSPSQARSNLGLSSAATMNTTASRTATSTTTVLQAAGMNNHRQSGDHDGRYPLLANIGSAAARDVQEYLLDTTANRLMTVGAFGLGGGTALGSSLFNSNFNASDIPTGIYTISGEWQNGPYGTQAYTGQLVHLHRWFDNQDVQTLYLAGLGNEVYYRSGNSSSQNWGGWVQQYHTGNLAEAFPCSLTLNGWEQLPNGRIRQWGTLDPSTSLIRSVNFPIVFPIECLNVKVTHRGTQANSYGASEPSRSGFTSYMQAQNNGQHCIFWEAIGR